MGLSGSIVLTKPDPLGKTKPQTGSVASVLFGSDGGVPEQHTVSSKQDNNVDLSYVLIYNSHTLNLIAVELMLYYTQCLKEMVNKFM